MSDTRTRKQALKSLKASLTPGQVSDLRLVIETAETQGDYNWNGEDSVFSDDVNETLTSLSWEFGPGPDKKTPEAPIWDGS